MHFYSSRRDLTTDTIDFIAKRMGNVRKSIVLH
jgi:hypothetical protein